MSCRLLCAVITSLFCCIQPAMSATLSPAPPAVLSGGDSLSAQTDWGFPGPFWIAPLVNWEHTDEVRVLLAVSSFPGEPDVPTAHTVILSARNNTPDAWQHFAVELEGPATFAAIPPPSVALVDPGTVAMTDQSLTFSDLAWTGFDDGLGFGTTAPISFAIDVVPPAPGESLVLTLRPSAAPEPGTCLLLGVGGLLIARRRRR